MFAWAPARVEEFRGEFDDDDIRSVVLVPLEVGTAIVFTEPSRLRLGAELAERTRSKIDVTTVLFLWNDEAACVQPTSRSLAPGWDWGTDEARLNLVVRPARFGPVTATAVRIVDSLSTSRAGQAKQVRAANRIARALSAPADVVLAHIREWNRGGPDVVISLLEKCGKHDLARVARLVDTDSFAVWRGARDLPVVPLVSD